MKNWSEFHIGTVYFSGLSIALICSILVIIYLRPLNSVIKKITGKFDAVWNINFRSTIIIGGLLGAMSVSFKDCKGDYDYLLKSKQETVMKGFEQISTSFNYLVIILIIWLIIFMILRQRSNKE